MSIVFFCQSCGSRFEVRDEMAGKKGHCRKCGQIMSIPRAAEIASMASMPALAMAGAGAAASVGGGPSWLAQAQSNVALAPLSITGKKYVPKPSPLDDASNSALYEVVDKVPRRRHMPGVSKPVSRVRVEWRNVLGSVQKVARWINQSAYLVSVPFIMVILSGTALKNRPLALFGATIVVLLNVGRVVSGLFNLVLIPFRESTTQGVFFLIPPFTFFYIANHWRGMKKPLQRVLVPIATIALIFLAFTFVPWLTRDGKTPTGDPRNLLRDSFVTLKKDISSQLDQVQNLDLKKIEELGGSQLTTLKAQLNKQISAARAASGQGKSASTSKEPAPGNPGGSVSDLVNELKRLQSEINGLSP